MGLGLTLIILLGALISLWVILKIITWILFEKNNNPNKHLIPKDKKKEDK